MMTAQQVYTQLQSLCIARQTLATTPIERRHWMDMSQGLYDLLMQARAAEQTREGQSR